MAEQQQVNNLAVSEAEEVAGADVVAKRQHSVTQFASCLTMQGSLLYLVLPFEAVHHKAALNRAILFHLVPQAHIIRPFLCDVANEKLHLGMAGVKLQLVVSKLQWRVCFLETFDHSNGNLADICVLLVLYFPGKGRRLKANICYSLILYLHCVKCYALDMKISSLQDFLHRLFCDVVGCGNVLDL